MLAAFGFFIAHGASAGVALRLPSERDPARLRALLELSAAAMGPYTWVLALLMIVSGVALGFIGSWWGDLWIWVAIVLFFVVTGVMTPLGAYRLNAIRTALGMSIMKRPAAAPLPPAEIEALLARYDPRPVTWVGGLGLAIVVLLMVLKP